MKRRVLFIAAALALGTLAGAILAGHRLAASGSSLSRGGGGLLAARLYLQQRGAHPVLLDRPLDGAASGQGTLVIAFPWQSRAFEIDHEMVIEHLARGGDLLLAYGSEPMPAPGELALLGALHLDTTPVASVPLAPWRWRSAAARSWELRRAEGVGLPPLTPLPPFPLAGGRGVQSPQEVSAGDPARGPLHLRQPRWLPALPKEGALLLGPGDEVVAAAFRERRGRVVVLPAELLANARIAEPAHAALLETLWRWLDGRWFFDEYHHGLGPAGETAIPSATRRGFDFLFLQLLLIYAAAALALSRRLGPAWREAPPLAGSAGGFLLRLGALHHRLDHHGNGAVLLLRRAAELDRRLAIDAELRALAERGDASALVEVGQAVARLQRR
jgi:hypothetical protein